MTLMTYRPRISIFDEFNKIFNGINTYDSNKLYNSIWQPAFDITEDNKNYYLSLDLPGVNKKDINVSISNDVLTISGFRDSSEAEDSDYARLNQVNYGDFEKSFQLPENINQDKVGAKMENGVLRLNLKKAREITDDVKKISIK